MEKKTPNRYGFVVVIPTETYTRLKNHCQDEGRMITKLVGKLVENYLDEIGA